MTRARRRAMVILLVVLFSAPLLTALLLRVTGWSPSATDNHGTLLEEPVALPVGAGSRYEGRWILVFTTASPCDRDCRNAFESVLRAHRGLGRDAHRVIVAYSRRVEGVGAAASAVDAGSAPWLDELAGAAPGGLRPNAVYLVDPRGYLAMWYPPGFEPSGVLEDLEQLLRYSRVGVQ